MEMFQQTNQGISFKVKVIPNSSRSEIVGWENEELKVRLAAIPEKGKANNELIRFLADILALSKSKVQLIYGEASRHKCICIEGLSLEQIQSKLPNI